VNIATESGRGGVPIGLVNVARDGRRTAEAWLADIVPVRAGVKLGSGSVYTLAAIGGGRDFLAAGLGLGVHVPHATWWLDADLSSYVIRGTDFREAGIDQLAELRVMAGFPITSQLSLFAGVSANATFDYDRGAPLDVA